MPLEDIYDYFRNYDKNTYQVVTCGEDAPSKEDIKAFEYEYNITLSEDFKEFTLPP